MDLFVINLLVLLINKGSNLDEVWVLWWWICFNQETKQNQHQGRDACSDVKCVLESRANYPHYTIYFHCQHVNKLYMAKSNGSKLQLFSWKLCPVFLCSLKTVHLCRSYDAIVGITSNDWFNEQGAKALDQGITKETKEKFLRSYILNNYENHLKEIFLSVNNEYSEWDQVSMTRTCIYSLLL